MRKTREQLMHALPFENHPMTRFAHYAPIGSGVRYTAPGAIVAPYEIFSEFKIQAECSPLSPASEVKMAPRNHRQGRFGAFVPRPGKFHRNGSNSAKLNRCQIAANENQSTTGHNEEIRSFQNTSAVIPC
jgi:hypothetical protein